MSQFTIVAIASPLEANYLDEWIEYHKIIGVDHFFIATNNWDWKPSDPCIETIRVDGR